MHVFVLYLYCCVLYQMIRCIFCDIFILKCLDVAFLYHIAARFIGILLNVFIEQLKLCVPHNVVNLYVLNFTLMLIL